MAAFVKFKCIKTQGKRLKMPSIRLSDGAKIEYIDTGKRNDTRPVLVFLHGWGLNHQAFWPQMALKEKYRLIFIDFRGCGKSRIGDDGISIDILGNDIFEFIEQLNLKNIHIIAWSMGAMALWRGIANNKNQQIKSVCIIDMSPCPANSSVWTNGIIGLQSTETQSGKERLEKALNGMKQDWRNFSQRMVARVISKKALEENGTIAHSLRDRLFQISCHSDANNMAILWNSLVQSDARENISKISIPTLLVFGMDNQLYPPTLCEWVEENIAQSILVRFETCGHAPHLEMPDAFNAVLAQFVDGLEEEAQSVPYKNSNEMNGGGNFSLEIHK